MKRLIYILLATALSACQPTPHDVQAVNALPDIYPDYIDVTIPVGIAPMNFDMDCAETMVVAVKGSRKGEMEARDARFDIDRWHQLTRENEGGDLVFTVTALIDGRWQQFRPFAMHVSQWPLEQYGLVYRKIAPGYETFSDIGMYQRSLASFDEECIFDVTDVDGQCMNCHYANRTSHEQYMVHVRGHNGATYLYDKGREVLLDTKTDSTCASCTYGYWHPGGRYCAFSLNVAQQNFYTGPRKTIEPWDRVSDIAVLDVESGVLLRSPLLEGSDFQTTPAFSADGGTLYFCAAPHHDMPADYQQVKYSLCSIAFDAATGTFGEKVDTIISGSSAGKSVSLPRPSYDGRWLMFCLTDQGTTPVSHVESDLWLMDIKERRARRMDEVNSPEADAYHNWAVGSHWFVFGSKRDDHLYSLPYLACIDDSGRATKPFLLPQENPRQYYLESLHSFNAPDFTDGRVGLDRRSFGRKVMKGDRQKVRVK